MLIYKDESKENIQVSIGGENAAVLNIEAFTIGNTRVPAQSFDLTGFQGNPFRLYAEKNGDLSMDTSRDHYWLLAEAVLPERIMECIFDDDGSMQFVELPLDLHDFDITIYALPEVAE